MIDSMLDLEPVFVDVRKAYRLLWGYHRRIIDTARLMQGVIAPQSERLGNPPTLTPMSSGRNLMASDDWLWDATPLISVSFLWVHHTSRKDWKGRHHPDDYMLDIHFIADSAFEEASEGDEPDPSKLPLPAECRTETRITVVKPRQDVSNTDWYRVWEENDYPCNGEMSGTWSDEYAVYSEISATSAFIDKEAIEIASKRFRTRAFDALELVQKT